MSVGPQPLANLGPGGPPSVAASPAAGGPWAGFPVAAAAAVADLHSRSRQDLWLISALDPGTDAAQVVAVAGPWATRVAPGVVLSWAEALLARTVAVDGPVCEPDMQRAGSRPSAVDGREPFRAYLGLPLRTADGQVFGALCAANGRPRPARAMTDALRAAQVLGTLLSTIRAGEQFAADRSRDAVEAHALATRDQLTGLRNRHGWQDAVAAEQERCQRYGGAASVVVLDLDGLKTVNDRSGHGAGDRLLVAAGQALSSTCRPGDVLSRLGGDEFGILAVECDARAARALTRRLRVHLRTADVRVSLGCATRRHGETLVDTWQRADEAMYREKRTRRARLLTDVGRTPVEPAREPAGTGP